MHEVMDYITPSELIRRWVSHIGQQVETENAASSCLSRKGGRSGVVGIQPFQLSLPRVSRIEIPRN